MTIRKSIVIDTARHENPIHQGMYVLERLRAVGVPATGVLYPTGVEYGQLIIEAADIVDGTTEYNWVAQP